MEHEINGNTGTIGSVDYRVEKYSGENDLRKNDTRRGEELPGNAKHEAVGAQVHRQTGIRCLGA